MYISMGHMFGVNLPDFVDNNFIALAITQMLLSLIIVLINSNFFISGFRSLMHLSPNMDTLVALGSSASFIYSVSVLFIMSDKLTKGNYDSVMALYHGLYFESAAMILTLITVGKLLEAKTKGKTTNALKSLVKIAPKNATILINGIETEISASQIKKGDIFVVKPGESIPADGIVTDGYCAVNESSLTGESIPQDKAKGDNVSSGTINLSGYITCEATKVGEDTLLSQIIKTISDAALTKAPIAKIADKVSGIFVPVVIGISVVTFFVWLLIGKSIDFSLTRAVSVLVISCPCALGLATPVAIMVGSGIGAKNSILFKNASSLEQTGRANIIVLDKTGTITKGIPEVTDVFPIGSVTENELIQPAYSLEIKSEHPIAKAITKFAESKNIPVKNSSDFISYAGNGLTAKIDEDIVYGGNLNFIKQRADIPESAILYSQDIADHGKTPIFLCKNNKFIGIISVADTVKEDSAKAINELKNMGKRIVMLTGDNKRTAESIKKLVGVDEVVSEVLPNGKADVIQSLKGQGTVIMVGDGINDAPALTAADIGIAIGAGTDIAIESADVVLMKSNLSDVPAALRLSKAVLKNIRENLFWAFIYNVIGIPLAAGVWIPLFGYELNPMFGAAAMSLSSFCVLTNSLRLNFINIYNNKKVARKKQNNLYERKIDMKRTIKIEGMMCQHCEARVKKALESVDGISEAIPNHSENSVVIHFTKDISDKLIKEIIEEQGYKFVD